MRNEGDPRKKGVRYDSLLLRVWRRSGQGSPEWSGRVEHIQAGTALRFSEPDALIAYVRAVIGAAASAPMPAPQAADGGPASAPCDDADAPRADDGEP